jgi:ATP-binding cassette, subfamily B, bacterial
MDHLCRYAQRPLGFLARYVRGRPISHAFILTAVLAAVVCSVSTQYGVKFLVDVLSGVRAASDAWLGFALLVSLIVADNLLWRLASWIANTTFVGVTGDLRRDLFHHLTGHAPSYFTERLPGTLTSRITATSNAVFTVENMFMWNVLPPCVATLVAIAWVTTVSVPMAAGLIAVAGILVIVMFRLAAAGRPLHHDFADKAAAVDGEMVDVVGNMPLVRAFGGLTREHRRFEATVDHEMTARRRSLTYLEKVRLLHAVITVVLTTALLAWALVLWQDGAATTGDVVLVATLGLSILHATRDLAVALVDVTQHMARLSEALATLLVPHALRDHPKATPLASRGASVVFDRVSFTYPDGRRVFENLTLRLNAGERVGLVGRSGGGKSSLFALVQRFYDVDAGVIRIDGQDVAQVTQASLRAQIAIVQQEPILFHRSLAENIAYGKPGATQAEIERASKLANAHDFIAKLPKGYGTLVGERGIKLSGGERQRVALARAFLADAPILILDEATSSLDSESEALIQEATERLMQGRTTIVIAHRLSTVRALKRILIFDRGRIIEEGDHHALIGREKGVYRRLFDRQVGGLLVEVG